MLKASISETNDSQKETTILKLIEWAKERVAEYKRGGLSYIAVSREILDRVEQCGFSLKELEKRMLNMNASEYLDILIRLVRRNIDNDEPTEDGQDPEMDMFLNGVRNAREAIDTGKFNFTAYRRQLRPLLANEKWRKICEVAKADETIPRPIRSMLLDLLQGEPEPKEDKQVNKRIHHRTRKKRDDRKK